MFLWNCWRVVNRRLNKVCKQYEDTYGPAIMLLMELSIDPKNNLRRSMKLLGFDRYYIHVKGRGLAGGIGLVSKLS